MTSLMAPSHNGDRLRALERVAAQLGILVFILVVNGQLAQTMDGIESGFEGISELPFHLWAVRLHPNVTVSF